MGFYVGSTGAGADAAKLVFDKKFADERFTEASKADPSALPAHEDIEVGGDTL